MEERLRLRSRSTYRSWAAIWKFPIEPTNSKPKSSQIGQPVVGAHSRTVQDGRKRPVPRRSMIFFREELGSSDRTERPVTRKLVHEMSVIQTRSSEDRKDFNVERAHERTGRSVITRDVINVSDSSQTRSAHESETFNVGDETFRERTERSTADHDESHESIMVNEADMDFRIPGLPHSVVKHAQSTSVRE